MMVSSKWWESAFLIQVDLLQSEDVKPKKFGSGDETKFHPPGRGNSSF